MRGFGFGFVAAFVLLVCMQWICCEQSNAGWLFGRRAAACANGSCSRPVAATLQRTVTRQTTVYAGENATAAGVARIMARLQRVGHFGGNPGYEGCGSGSTAAAAYANCCFANSGMRTVDYGIAQGANGMFYCCRRYAR